MTTTSGWLRSARWTLRQWRDRVMRAEHLSLARHDTELTALRDQMAALQLDIAEVRARESPPPPPSAVVPSASAVQDAERMALLEALVATALDVGASPGAIMPAGPPAISVIMPVRNREGVISCAIRSIQAQSFGGWELLVIDDGSIDGTRMVVEAFLGDSRIRLIQQAAVGQSAARNQGLKAARGDVIAYLDSDNTAFPGYLAGLVGSFAADPTFECAYAALVADAPDIRASRIAWRPFDRAALLLANTIDLNVFAHRRVLAERVGGFDEELTRLADWDFILRCTRHRAPRRLALAGARYCTTGTDRVSVRENLGANLFRVRQKLLPALPRKLRVLYAVWHYPQLSETYIEAEIRSMQRRGVDVEVWSEDDVAVPYAAAAAWHRGTLEAAIERVRPDIVHIHWVNSAVTHAPAATARGIPVTVRGHGFDVTPGMTRALLAQPGIERVYLFGHQIAPLGIADVRIRPLPAAFDTVLFRPASGKDRRLVVRTATALPAKDFALFFELARRMPEYRFVLAACTAYKMETYPAEIRAMADAMGSPAELHFDLSREATAELVAQAGLYLHTVVATDAPGFTPIGMPISIAEAMATGAVAIVRDVPGLADYVGDAGLTYHDIDSAEAAIRATAAWDDAAWQDAARRSIDRAWLNHADDLVLAPLLDDWLALAASRA